MTEMFIKIQCNIVVNQDSGNFSLPSETIWRKTNYKPHKTISFQNLQKHAPFFFFLFNSSMHYICYSNKSTQLIIRAANGY